MEIVTTIFNASLAIRIVPGIWKDTNITILVMDGSEAVGDLVLIQTFLLYYVNQVVLMLTSIFQGQFP